MSNFAFLPKEFNPISEAAATAEGHIMGDPRAACFHARFTLEAVVHWLYRHDNSLRMPYDRSLGALLHEPTFQNLLPEAVFQKARVIQKVGNQAVHNPRQRAYAGERKYVVLTVQDPKFKNTLIEPGDIVIFSKDTERHQRLITECRGGQRNSGYLAFKLSGQTDDPILSEEAKTQVEFYKKQR